MELSNELLDELSAKLRRAVGLTLKLDTNEKIFIGNEERYFLFALVQRLPGSSHKTSSSIDNYSLVTNHNFHDVWRRDCPVPQDYVRGAVLSRITTQCRCSGIKYNFTKLTEICCSFEWKGDTKQGCR